MMTSRVLLSLLLLTSGHPSKTPSDAHDAVEMKAKMPGPFTATKDSVLEYLAGKFHQGGRPALLPRDVRAAFAQKAGMPTFEMARSGGRFRPTDTSPPEWPLRRLVLAATSEAYSVIHYERGGMGHGFYVIVFRTAPNTSPECVWAARVRRGAKSLDDLRAFVREGDYQDTERFLW